LHFVGGHANGKYVITGAPSCSEAAAYCAAILGTLDLKATSLQQGLGQIAVLGHRAETERFRQSCEDFARLNNEFVNIQRELTKKTAELERMNHEKNRLLGVVAHDLRNPLGIILSCSQFLGDELSDLMNQEQREILSVIRTRVEFMRQLIDELLNFAKYDLSTPELRQDEADIVALVQNAVSLNSVLAARKSIQLKFASDSEGLILLLDKTKMEQVLNNLVSNAIKFSFRGTTVDVEIRHDHESVVISVKDQGKGIPANEFDQLFKPFQETTVAPTAGESSTGLGLMIVQKIVTAHHGSIKVESEVGKGTVFYVSLPVMVKTRTTEAANALIST
jgi:two-component system, OmpR family, sensor kinase